MQDEHNKLFLVAGLFVVANTRSRNTLMVRFVMSDCQRDSRIDRVGD